MGENRGKAFENIIKEAFLKVPDVSVDRLHDQMTGYKVTSANICDFIVYKKPYEYYIECKSVHGNTLPFSNITTNQWNGLLEKSKIDGVFAGVICWWIKFDTTLFLPIQTLDIWRNQVGLKSIKHDIWEKDLDVIKINGKKKRVFFDYDMTEFFTHFK